MKDTIKVTKFEKRESNLTVRCYGATYCLDKSKVLHYHQVVIDVPVEVEETIDRPMTIAEAKVIWPLYLKSRSAKYFVAASARNRLREIFTTDTESINDYTDVEFTNFIDSLVDPESVKESVQESDSSDCPCGHQYCTNLI